MSRWFIDHRQQFIADSLRIYGQVNRSTLADQFDISAPQASVDIALFMRQNPDAMIYDGRCKAYVVNTEALPPPPTSDRQGRGEGEGDDRDSSVAGVDMTPPSGASDSQQILGKED